MCIYTHVYEHVYIDCVYISICIYIYTHIYIYMYTYRDMLSSTSLCLMVPIAGGWRFFRRRRCPPVLVRGVVLVIVLMEVGAGREDKEEEH